MAEKIPAVLQLIQESRFESLKKISIFAKEIKKTLRNLSSAFVILINSPIHFV